MVYTLYSLKLRRFELPLHMRIAILSIMLCLLAVACKGPESRDPFFVWAPVEARFDSATVHLERAYCFSYSPDTLLMLSRRLDSMASADPASMVKRGRACYFMARYYDAMSPYSEGWKEKAAQKIRQAMDCYADTARWPYDMFRIRYIREKNAPRTIERTYFYNIRALADARRFGDSLMVAGVLNNIGNVLAELGDSAGSLRYFQQSKTIFHSLGVTKWEQRVSLSEAQSLTSSSLRQSDSIMLSLLSYSEATGDTLFSTMLLHNLYSQHGEKKYIERARQLVTGNPGYANMQAYYDALLARELTASGGDPDSASAMTLGALSKISATMLPEYAMTVYLAGSEAMRHLGHTDSALSLMERYRLLADSVYLEISGLDVMRNIALRKIAEAEATAIREKGKERALYLYLIFAVVMTAMGILIWLYRRQNALRMSKMKAELDLAQSQLQLASSRLVVTENENAIGKAMDSISAMRDEGKISDNDAASVLSELKAHITNREELQTFEKIYENLNPNFTRLLKERWPALTEGHLRMATYVAMGMSNRQIARVMMVEYRSVITSRYRLRTKMGLAKDESLEDALREFSRF